VLKIPHRKPSQPLAAAVVAPVLAGIAVVSGVVNLLALTSPLFMLQVYDRVLASRSVSTLVGLAVLAVVLFAFQSMLDVIRGRVLLRIGETFDRKLSGRVHEAIVSLPLKARMPGDGLQPLRDLDNVRGFLSGQGPTALFDLPWMPLYLGICFLFHFWIGITALVGAIVLVSLTVVTDALSRGPTRAAMQHGMARNALMEAGRRNAEAVRAMGLGGRVAERWQKANTDYLAANRRTGDIAGGLGGVSRSLRMILQSAMLAVGAYLVIRQETSAGVMIASSIMMGRALAPVDLAIASWKPFLMARQSWGRLGELFALLPETRAIMALPKPERELRAEAMNIAPPGEKKPTLMGVNLVLPAGSALGIIGPSGSASGRQQAARCASMAGVLINGTGKSWAATSAICHRVSNCSMVLSLRISPVLKRMPTPAPSSRRPGRRARTISFFALTAAMRPGLARRARPCRRGNASASVSLARFIVIRFSSCSTNPTRTSMRKARRPSSRQ
jgi:PrtD family type I secretion system ABC transporter